MVRRTSTPVSSHHITVAAFPDPLPLVHFAWPSSRSSLTLKEKYQIELKLLVHPKHSPVRAFKITHLFPQFIVAKSIPVSHVLCLSGRVVM